MKRDVSLFNPVINPELKIPASQSSASKANASAKKSGSHARLRKTSRNSKTGKFARRIGRKAKETCASITSNLQKRLAGLESKDIKRVLVACGIAAAVALVIIALAKHTALIVVLLIVLGAMAVLNLWTRILRGGI